MLITIDIDKKINGLFGEENGKKLFNTQVKTCLVYLNSNDPIELVFPKTVKRITTSFYAGLLSNLIAKYGPHKMKDLIIIRLNNKEIKIIKELF